MDKAKMMRKARALLRVSDENVKIPSQIYFNCFDPVQKQNVKEAYLNRRREVLEALAQGKKVVISTDLDGTLAYKNCVKVNNTSSIAALQDIHWLRLLAKAVSRLGGVLEINTARPAVLSGPSIVSPEGKGGYRVSESISGVLQEFGIFDYNSPENKKILDTLVFNGLSGGVTHKPGEPLKVNQKTVDYAKFLEFLNSVSLPNAKNGLLAKLEEICRNEEEGQPLRIFEYKSLPRYLLDNTDAKLSDYLKFIDLSEKAKKEKWSSQKFCNAVEQLDIPMDERYKTLLNPEDVNCREKMTTTMRSGAIVCLTPHALDSDNVQRDDLKAEMYQAIADFCRSDEAQQWAFDNYGIPKGTELFTINTYVPDKIKKFTAETINTMRDDLKKNSIREKNVGFFDIKDNGQPYLELAPKTVKDQTQSSYAEAKETNEFSIGSGDSPGTDAPILAQAIINGGAGFRVRGLMGVEDVMSEMVDLLGETKNQGHPDQLELVDPVKKIYKHVASGEVKHKAEFVKDFVEKYGDKFHPADHTTQNNAFNAAIFSEFLGDEEGYEFDLDSNASWVKSVHDNANKRNPSTPYVHDMHEEMAKTPTPRKTTFERLPSFLRNFPILNSALKAVMDYDNSPAIFNSLLGVCSYVLMGAGAVGTAAKIVGQKDIMEKAKLAQRIAYGVNNIASGVGRGLRQSIVYPWQFIGEMFGLASSILPENSIFGQTLRALANTVLIGRGNETIMRENYNLDGFSKAAGVKEEVDEVFGEDKAEFANIRKPAARLTKFRMALSRWIRSGMLGKIPGVGNFFADALADLIQAFEMGLETLKIPALRKGAFKNLIDRTGVKKLSKNSGREYQNVHSPGHVYGSFGLMTMFTGIASTVLGVVTGNKKLDRVLTNLANFLPTFGMVAAARHLDQDAYGDPRVFTGVKRNSVALSPERAGWWQRMGAWGQAICAWALQFDVGQLLFNASTGAYLEGVREELKVRLDDSVINEWRRQGKSFQEEAPKSKEVTEFAKNFHADVPIPDRLAQAKPAMQIGPRPKGQVPMPPNYKPQAASVGAPVAQAA